MSIHVERCPRWLALASLPSLLEACAAVPPKGEAFEAQQASSCAMLSKDADAYRTHAWPIEPTQLPAHGVTRKAVERVVAEHDWDVQV